MSYRYSSVIVNRPKVEIEKGKTMVSKFSYFLGVTIFLSLIGASSSMGATLVAPLVVNKIRPNYTTLAKSKMNLQAIKAKRSAHKVIKIQTQK